MVFNVKQQVRLKKNMEFGNTQLRKNTQGVVVSVKKRTLGKNEYVIRWNGLDFDMTMLGESNISPSGDLA